MHFRAVCIPLFAALIATAPSAPAPASRHIAPNDNRHAAGSLANGVLTVSLEARQGDWQPEGKRGLTIATAAFAEAGGELQDPGPLIRVPVGTEIRATVSNKLLKPMWLYGMGAKRGGGDSVRIAPNERKELRFRATDAGAYYYAARTDTLPGLARFQEDSQLGGVIIVDPAGYTPPANERILAITSWFKFDPTRVSGLGPTPNITFNGLAWPATERMTFVQGDTVRFRVVNMSILDHPLHLHGFYFTVDAKGDGERDTVYSARDTRTAVTEYMPPLSTMAMTWVPTTPGNWIFHCHFASHITTNEALEADRSDMSPHMQHASMLEHMSGLVLGITVTPRGNVSPVAAGGRPIRLLVRSRPRVYGKYVGYGFLLGGSANEANRDSLPVPGPVLELTKGERVAITIVNQSHDQAAVHWHGIELESYPDGVPGWSGAGTRVMPSISPGDSLTVRFTPPRAGTFMYHSHSNEMQQIGSGLYGAIVVSEPGVKRDTTRDRVLVFSDGGPVVSFADIAALPPGFVNGQAKPQPIDIPAGVPVRLRLIDIRTEMATTLSLVENGAPIEWRLVAKDGMPTPAHQSTLRPATLTIAPGEIYDFEITRPAGSTVTLNHALFGLPPQFTQPGTLTIRAR